LNSEFPDEVEVFCRETELTLSEVEGENRKISGCLQGVAISLNANFQIVLENSWLSLQAVQVRAQRRRVIGATKARAVAGNCRFQIAD
jgi:hypothetical protein